MLFDRPGEFSYRTEQPCRIYEVPASVIKNVPIVMWKMFEAYELRGAR